MASSTRRRSVGVDSDPLRRTPPSPKAPPPVCQFVKVVLDSAMETKMLKIPPRFVKSGPQLSDTVTLETPCGFKQKIQLKRVDGDLWFQDGWSEFARRHSIAKGHMLLFDFRGDSSFRVLIFDMSASEVEYAPNNSIPNGENEDELAEEEEFLGRQGIRDGENDIIDASDLSDGNGVKPVAVPVDPGTSVQKRKKNAGWIDDSDVEEIDGDEFSRSTMGKDAKIRVSNTKQAKKRVYRDNGFRRTPNRNQRGQSAKFLDDDPMDIEVLGGDEIVHNREKKPSI